ncbi:hypothetical protein SH139x_005778 [Planctomycetaceae bacterium SH139]
MSLARFWSTIKLLHLSQPAGDRALYRAVRGRQIGSVLEVNVGTAARSQQLVQWLRLLGNQEAFRYVAVDAYESGGAGHISLKSFHSVMGKLGVKPLPIPEMGNLSVALTRVAHTIGAVDLVILDCPPSEFVMGPVATILPRLVGPNSLVMAQAADVEGLRPLDISSWETVATRAA